MCSCRIQPFKPGEHLQKVIEHALRVELFFLVLLSLLLSTTPYNIEGQTVSGQVVDATTGFPVARGFVVLFDNSNREIARTLTSSDGRYTINATEAGLYSLRSERIGYEAWESEPFVLTTAQNLELTVSVTSLPTRLATFVVTAEDRCGDLRGTATFDPVWEEARKALTAASWTAQQGYRDLLHRYDRFRTRNSEIIESERVWGVVGTALQPFAAISADSLINLGYVIESDSIRLYFGPDANVMLDESFHRSHCFQVQHGTGDNEGFIGIGFRPDPARHLPDIDGTLWLDASTAELRRIDWQYVNAFFDLEDERIGGQVFFQALPSGAWIVNKWRINMPTVEKHPGMHVLMGFREAGGDVIELKDMAGQTVYTAPEMVHISGLAYDSTRRSPSARQLVSILGTGYTALTDSEGRFEIKAILDGEYGLALARMDSLGYLQGRERIIVRPGDSVDVNLTIPRISTIQRSICPDSLIPEGTRALVGVVRYAVNDAPVKDMELVAWWNPLGFPPSWEERVGSVWTRTDLEGNFAFCSLPLDMNIRVDLNARNHSIDPVDIVFDGYRVVVEAETYNDLYLTFDRIGKVDLTARADSVRN